MKTLLFDGLADLCDDIVAKGFVGASMALVFFAVAYQSLVMLTDVVFSQLQIIIDLEHKVQCLSITSDSLLIPRVEGLDFDVREKRFDLRLGKPRDFNTG